MPNVSEVKTIQKATDSGTGAQTNTELVAADATKRIHITNVIWSSTVTTDFTLESDGTQIYKILSSSQHILDGHRFKRIECDFGDSLTYSTAAGDCEVYVEYYTE